MLGIGYIASVAALIGDPARANMLYALHQDGLIAAGDLANIAGVAPSTASEHLARLLEAGLVRVETRGRRRYYRLTDARVGEMLVNIETLSIWLSKRAPRKPPPDRAMLHSRNCMDHLAGTLGGMIANALIARDFLLFGHDGPVLSASGDGWLVGLGIDVDALRSEPRRLVSLCPDWTDDSPHLGGSVGAAVFHSMLTHGWLRRAPGSATVQVTPKGTAALRHELGIQLSGGAARPG